MNKLRKLYVDFTDELVARLNDWMLRGELNRHRPELVELPGKTEPWCFGCGQPWPCSTWERVADLYRKNHPVDE